MTNNLIFESCVIWNLICLIRANLPPVSHQRSLFLLTMTISKLVNPALQRKHLSHLLFGHYQAIPNNSTNHAHLHTMQYTQKCLPFNWSLIKSQCWFQRLFRHFWEEWVGRVRQQQQASVQVKEERDPYLCLCPASPYPWPLSASMNMISLIFHKIDAIEQLLGSH